MMREKQYPDNIRQLDRFKRSIPLPKEALDLIHKKTCFEYYEITKDPKAPWVLVTYQIHPDEKDAADIIEPALADLIYQKGVPNILFVPRSTPTGVVENSNPDILFKREADLINQWLILHPDEPFSMESLYKKHPELLTKTNAFGTNLNWGIDRDFDPEIVIWKQLLENRKFKYSIHIHHDYEMLEKKFYAYFHTKERLRTQAQLPFLWSKFIDSLSKIGFYPNAGNYDDLDNPALCRLIPDDGLILSNSKQSDFESNFENFLAEKGIVSAGALTIELPNGLKNKDYYTFLKMVLQGLLDNKKGYIQ